ncbi:MAG: uroporphyrinogen decarboxylase family protein [Gemmatimonadota bacterium]|nr:uroporphyrinogen decarboxylase family protein [Gemmatimonadota bacterium]
MARPGHRERVLRTIRGRDIDRIPFFFRAEPPVKKRLKREFNLKTDMDLISYFDADAIHIGVSYRKECLRQSDEERTFYDIFGNKIRSVQYGDILTDTVVDPVLADVAEVDHIDRIKWPDSSFIDFYESKKQARAAHETGLAVYGGVWASIFTHSRAMMGEENYLVSLVSNPDLISRLVERITDCFLELNEAYLSECSRYIDIYYFGSDFGTQNSLFISREMFCEFFKPHLKRLTAHAKGFGLPVMFHTCGAVSEIIPDLIECGVDILDPVQVSAADMAPENLARKFKEKIAFHGGISTQTTLPNESPEVVREEVIRTISALGPLRYIVAPDQEMIGDIPTENIEVMFETIRKHKI